MQHCMLGVIVTGACACMQSEALYMCRKLSTLQCIVVRFAMCLLNSLKRYYSMREIHSSGCMHRCMHAALHMYDTMMHTCMYTNGVHAHIAPWAYVTLSLHGCMQRHVLHADNECIRKSCNVSFPSCNFPDIMQIDHAGRRAGNS
jgi:hypothetical protein